MDFTAEISGNMLENEEDLNEDRMAKVEALKAEKRELKGAITKQLNELAGVVAVVSSGVEPRSSEEIKATLEIAHRAPVVQLDEHRAVTREVVSSTPAGPSLRVLK